MPHASEGWNNASLWTVHRLAPANTSGWAEYMRSWTRGGFVQRLWHDDDMEPACASAVPRLVRRIMALRTKVERTDIARLCIIYMNGGIYADLDVSLAEPASISAEALRGIAASAAASGTVLLPMLEYTLTKEERQLHGWGHARVQQAGQHVILSMPRHPMWLTLIAKLVEAYDPNCCMAVRETNLCGWLRLAHTFAPCFFLLPMRPPRR